MKVSNLKKQLSNVGMHRRPTYDEIANTITNPQLKLKYPNRLAIRLAKTPQAQQFLGVNEGIIDLQEQSNKLMRVQLYDANIRHQALASGVSENEIRASHSSSSSGSSSPQSFYSEYESSLHSDMDDEAERRALLERARASNVEELGRAHVEALQRASTSSIPPALRPQNVSIGTPSQSSLPSLEDIEPPEALTAKELLNKTYRQAAINANAELNKRARGAASSSSTHMPFGLNVVQQPVRTQSLPAQRAEQIGLRTIAIQSQDKIPLRVKSDIQRWDKTTKIHQLKLRGLEAGDHMTDAKLKEIIGKNFELFK